MTRTETQGCTLVIPAYNEEKRISDLLFSLFRFQGKIIFICDGTDRTPEIIEGFCCLHPDVPIRILRFPRRLGKGGGVIEGLRAADTPCVGYMDADGSTSPDEMERLFGYLGTADAVIGSRWLQDSQIIVRQGIMRRIQSRMFNTLVRLLFGLRFRDTQCGAKAFRKKAIDDVLPDMRSGGFEFDVELLWRMQQAGFTIIEVPTHWENKGASRVRIIDAIGMGICLIKLRIRG